MNKRILLNALMVVGLGISLLPNATFMYRTIMQNSPENRPTTMEFSLGLSGFTLATLSAIAKNPSPR